MCETWIDSPWLKRLQAAGIAVSETDLQQARESLEAQYSGKVIRLPSDSCPTCFGANVVKVNLDAEPWDNDFGRIKPCPDPYHYEQRQRTMAKISNLSVDELAIRLADCQEFHDTRETIIFAGMNDENGEPIYFPRSNRMMLQKFRQLAESPYDYEHFIYVWGPYGGGKTYAAMGLVNEIDQAHRGPAMYITLMDLLQFLKAAYDDRNRDEEFGDWSFDRRYEEIKNAPVIVLDEFDFSHSKTQATEHNLYLIQRWVNDRYRKAVSGQSLTVFLANTPVEDTGLEGVISRINDSRFRRILNSAPDWRRRAGK